MNISNFSSVSIYGSWLRIKFISFAATAYECDNSWCCLTCNHDKKTAAKVVASGTPLKKLGLIIKSVSYTHLTLPTKA